jgi:hypothetical protein
MSLGTDRAWDIRDQLSLALVSQLRPEESREAA